MPEPGTAVGQLERILFLLPLASRAEGVTLAAAARTLDVDLDTVLKDIGEITAREFYHPAGSAEELQISLEAELLKVGPSRKFARPPKLSREEALALRLGLQALAADAGRTEREQLRLLAERLETDLASPAGSGAEEGAGTVLSVEEDEPSGAGMRAMLLRAARVARRVRVVYLKPGDSRPAERTVDPYCVVHGAGGWYLIGWCHASEGVRIFRLDRILEAHLVDGKTHAFEVPSDFDVAEFLRDGHVFRSSADGSVRIRYSRRIAPWIREKGDVEELDDGGVAVDYVMADPGWAVRHALLYGREAEIVAPPEVRGLARKVLRQML